MCGFETWKSHMGEDGEGSVSSSSMTMNLSLQSDKYPKDLLQRFVSSFNRSDDTTVDKETEELELTLGLSLAGQFGSNKNHKRKLARSSSISGLMLPLGEDSPSLAPSQGSFPMLTRATSLPTETEEEWRKKKELQTLRRMAAKKRRLEKQRSLNSKAEKDGGFGGGVAEVGPSRKDCGTVAPPFRLWSWVDTVFDGGAYKGGSEEKGVRGSDGVVGFVPQNSQGSGSESQGGSVEGLLESDSRPRPRPRQAPELGSCSRARNYVNGQLLQDPKNNTSGVRKKESIAWTSKPEVEIPSSKPADTVGNRGKEIGINSMEDMPCVFTKGDGPKGKRIEGILYKYGKGEEVRIMCVCHGSFLSPAEFVKHAGGGDVLHPLRHIVINPNPSFMR
ncbi:hypothetical protein SAY87_020076 [Trapa incisa]|uniref:Ninja-family protein n=1 Tax=Trapa incisa TaxID=236973 RepID=A0AAN7K0V9_9MYRT|nr:hypothetical protein SAY87_020076 [Trapa incisa]